MSKKNEYYLSPQDFFRGVVTAKIEGRVTDELGRMFLLLAKKTAMHRYWIRYSHIKDDIESESLYACMKAFNGFKPFQKSYASEHGEWDEKTMIEYDYNIHYNPHAWFTTAIMNRLKQFMKSEYNQKNIFNKMKLEVGLDADYGYMEMMDESDDYDQNQDDDVIDNEHQFGYDVEEETEESVEQPKIKFNGDR